MLLFLLCACFPQGQGAESSDSPNSGVRDAKSSATQVQPSRPKHWLEPSCDRFVTDLPAHSSGLTKVWLNISTPGVYTVRTVRQGNPEPLQPIIPDTAAVGYEPKSGISFLPGDSAHVYRCSGLVWYYQGDLDLASLAAQSLGANNNPVHLTNGTPFVATVGNRIFFGE